MSKKLNHFLKLISLTIISLFTSYIISLAWTEPTSNPPYGNISAPINVSNQGQIKYGGLLLNLGGATTGLIVANGNVGIGTIDPLGKLSVKGGNIVLERPTTSHAPGHELVLQSWAITMTTEHKEIQGLTYNNWAEGTDTCRINNKNNKFQCEALQDNDGYTCTDYYTETVQQGNTSYISYWTATAVCKGNTSKYSLRTFSENLEFLNNNDEVKMIITQTGNVGIGTTTPGAKLDVAGRLALSGLENPKYGGASAGVAIIGTPNSGGGLLFRPAGLDNASGEVLFRSGVSYFSGNVGIGTTTPGAKLDVAGRLALSGLENPKYGGASAGVAIIGTPNSGGGLLFRPAGLDNASGEVLFRSGVSYFSGNVGIGTTTPASKLSVLGNLTLLRMPGANITPGPGHEITLESPSNNTATERSGWESDNTAPDTCDGNRDEEYYCRSGSGGTTCQDVAKLGQKAGYYKRQITCIAGTDTYTLRTNAGTFEFINTAGDKKMVITQSGNVGIGTTAPTEKLDIQGGRLRVGNTQIWDNEINRYNNDNLYIGYRNTANTILQANGGNVGIGTTAPGAKLDVAGRLALSGLENPKYGGASAGVAIIGTPNSRGGLLFRPAGLDNASGEVLFRSGVSYFSGNVGIGTTAPGAKLDIYATESGPGGWLKGLHFSRPEHSAITLFNSTYGGLLFGLHGINQTFYFGRYNTDGSWDKYTMMIDVKTGNVGIGTTAPGYKLEVQGQIRTSGDIFVAGTPAPAIRCNFEGTWSYNDDGDGNDFAITCRNGIITGWCGSPCVNRGFHPEVYCCEQPAR
jgi:hypothetical protein